MNTRILGALAAVTLALPAYADVIDLTAPNPVSAPGPIFQGLPGNRVAVTASGWGGLVDGYESVGGASAIFDGLALFGSLTGPHTYSVSSWDLLSYHDSLNHLDARIDWSSVYFGDFTVAGPSITGTGRVSDASGSPDFLAEYPAGSTFSITANFANPFCATLSCIESTYLLNGEINPDSRDPAPVPAPPIGFPLLLGALLFAVGRRVWGNDNCVPSADLQAHWEAMRFRRKS